MGKKRCKRRVVVPMPPRALRPKLDTDQVLGLGIAHMQNLDDIANGRGTEQTMWHIVEAAFTWSYVADKLQAGVPEMATRVVERYGRTGRVGFSGLEYQVAKLGVEVMDQLAKMVDLPTAVAATHWSEAKVDALVQRHESATA